MFAFEWDFVSFEEFFDAFWGTGYESRVIPEEKIPDIGTGESIDIFARIDNFDDVTVDDVRGEWCLHKNPMDIRILIILLYLSNEFILTHITRELTERKLHPYSLTGSAFHRDIRATRWIVPDEDDREVGFGLAFGDFFTDVFVNSLCDRASVEEHERSGQKLSRE
jgi:hypothetical protein